MAGGSQEWRGSITWNCVRCRYEIPSSSLSSMSGWVKDPWRVWVGRDPRDHPMDVSQPLWTTSATRECSTPQITPKLGGYSKPQVPVPDCSNHSTNSRTVDVVQFIRTDAVARINYFTNLFRITYLEKKIILGDELQTTKAFTAAYSRLGFPHIPTSLIKECPDQQPGVSQFWRNTD